jgi:hypothetical protein
MTNIYFAEEVLCHHDHDSEIDFIAFQGRAGD